MKIFSYFQKWFDLDMRFQRCPKCKASCKESVKGTWNTEVFIYLCDTIVLTKWNKIDSIHGLCNKDYLKCNVK